MSAHTINPASKHYFPQSVLTNSIDLAGRIGLAAIFLLSGLSKIQNYEGSAQYLASGGLPEFLLPFAIAFEVFGALMLIIGFQLRWVALAFAAFSLLTAALFHANIGEQMQFILFFKNIAIAGGLLMIAAHGAGGFSIDAKQGR